jgi:hypothetical protein
LLERLRAAGRRSSDKCYEKTGAGLQHRTRAIFPEDRFSTAILPE